MTSKRTKADRNLLIRQENKKLIAKFAFITYSKNSVFRKMEGCKDDSMISESSDVLGVAMTLIARKANVKKKGIQGAKTGILCVQLYMEIRIIISYFMLKMLIINALIFSEKMNHTVKNGFRIMYK